MLHHLSLALQSLELFLEAHVRLLEDLEGIEHFKGVLELAVEVLGKQAIREAFVLRKLAE